MSAETTEADHPTGGGNGKKKYEAPRLIEYGRAVDLTGGGSGSKQEKGQPKGDKFP